MGWHSFTETTYLASSSNVYNGNLKTETDFWRYLFRTPPLTEMVMWNDIRFTTLCVINVEKKCLMRWCDAYIYIYESTHVGSVRLRGERWGLRHTWVMELDYWRVLKSLKEVGNEGLKVMCRTKEGDPTPTPSLLAGSLLWIVIDDCFGHLCLRFMNCHQCTFINVSSSMVQPRRLNKEGYM